MLKIQMTKILLIFAAAQVFFSVNVLAQSIQLKTMEKAFVLKDKGNANDQLIEPSAVETIDKAGKYLLVADDKTAELRVVNAADGKWSGNPLKFDSPKKPKWEAMAKDSQGFFYVIGSHAAKSDDDVDKLVNRSHLYRFRLANSEDVSKIEIEPSSLAEFDIKCSLKDLKLYTDAPSEKNVKIEGLAVQTVKGKQYLVFGFREPSDLMQVYIAEIPANVTPNVTTKLSLRPYFRFDAKMTKDNTKFKLSSIEYMPDWNGFLILTSSETTEKVNGKDKPVFHGNAIWFVGNEQLKIEPTTNNSADNKPVEAQKIADFETTMKAEGFCLIPTADKKVGRFAIVYDNDTEDMQKAAPDNFLLGMMQFMELTK